MLVHSAERGNPSIVVAEGTTFTLNSDHVSQHPNMVINLRRARLRPYSSLPAVHRHPRPSSLTLMRLSMSRHWTVW